MLSKLIVCLAISTSIFTGSQAQDRERFYNSSDSLPTDESSYLSTSISTTTSSDESSELDLKSAIVIDMDSNSLQQTYFHKGRKWLKENRHYVMTGACIVTLASVGGFLFSYDHIKQAFLNQNEIAYQSPDDFPIVCPALTCLENEDFPVYLWKPLYFFDPNKQEFAYVMRSTSNICNETSYWLTMDGNETSFVSMVSERTGCPFPMLNRIFERFNTSIPNQLICEKTDNSTALCCANAWSRNTSDYFCPSDGCLQVYKGTAECIIKNSLTTLGGGLSSYIAGVSVIDFIFITLAIIAFC